MVIFGKNDVIYHRGRYEKLYVKGNKIVGLTKYQTEEEIYKGKDKVRVLENIEACYKAGVKAFYI